MPYRSAWVDPEIYLTHNGVMIFHTYKDDDIQKGRLLYSYTLDPSASVNNLSSAVFDVRDLAGYVSGCAHDEIIRIAIEHGDSELTKKEYL
jgi:hypothetical protein